MQPQWITKPAFTVVGMQIRTTPKAAEIPQLWEKFGPRMNEIQHLVERGPTDTHHVAYGLLDHFDTKTGGFDYLAGEAVVKVDELPPGMTRWDIPTSTYAVFEASLPTLGEVFDHIYKEWLPTSGYQQAQSPVFERYGERSNADGPGFPVSIYLPVQKKA